MILTARLGMAGIILLALSCPALGAPAKVGKPAPKFTISTFDKRKVTLDDLRGKVIVINYWATWCAPCKAEMPMMDAYRRKLGAAGLEIYAVTTEGSVPKSKLRELERVLSFPLASSLRGGGYGVLDAVPTKYVIDRNGILRYAKAGSFSVEEFGALILPLLREAAPRRSPRHLRKGDFRPAREGAGG